MHDIRAIRETPELYEKAWAAKGSSGRVAEILDLDARLRAAQTAGQQAQAERNDASKRIGQAKARKDEAEAQALMAQVESLKGALAEHAEAERTAGEQLRAIVSSLPNLPAPDVPPGADENDNVEVRRWGQPFAIAAPKDHTTLGEASRLMDFEAAARMSGARFVVLKGELARLERAVGQFMLDIQTREHGYLEVAPPLLVRSETMFGTGQLPKFTDDQFAAFPGLETARAVADPSEAPELRWLIPTAEVSLTNLVREQITAEEELPMRLTALTHCFRAEAGASGRDTRGMIRQHQFQKVEMVSITTPEQSEDEHERMVGCAEAVLKRLELPFRTMLLCAGDMGFSARKTYDLEVWLPSEDRYREISSCSNCGDFQARRMDARTKKAGEKGTRFVHTLNGSGLAVGRTLVAIMENYQDEGGRIAIPQALHPYMPGVTHIGGRG
ncbi:serine--tRNA ligase [Phenylobacterium sp. SCN 70-31]|uniref:serine--tRNA ligase n=1 Tax=Phenylobacterium sp. SCN 70-31 TaxID=1660129 RepID=UPI000869EDD6|nr:serine--tRNA ligase [Phenylobacterium sp. SCN 70-31]ODT87081.1 MAG: serine--tRNA ligase [Phenylobacterium sp. SCN 70-31]